MGEENTTESKGNSSAPAPKNNTNKVLILIIVILVGVVGVMGYQFLQKDEDDRQVHNGRATFVSEKNVDEVKELLEEEVEDAYYTASMNIDWNFYDGKSVSTNAYVENAKENNRTVYFDVNLNSTGELVYSSPYLPVGETLEGFALDKELPAGDYPAVLTYYLVDDNHEVITTVAVAITIHVLN